MISSLAFFPLDMCILSDIYYVWLNSYFFQRYKISIFYFPVHWMYPQPEVYVLCSYYRFSNLFITNKCKGESSQSQAKWINRQIFLDGHVLRSFETSCFIISMVIFMSCYFINPADKPNLSGLKYSNCRVRKDAMIIFTFSCGKNE